MQERTFVHQYAPGRRGCWQPVAAFAAVAFAALLAAPAAAAAPEVGVGISVNPIALTHPLHPAQHTALPAVYVKNTGTGPADYTLRIARIGTPAARDIPAGWVHISTPTLRLEPAHGAWIGLALDVPAGAPDGRYASDVVAGSTFGAAVRGQTARFGDQAATPLTFTVDHAAGPVADVTSTRANGLPWWVYLAMIAGPIAVIALWRGGLRIRFERH